MSARKTIDLEALVDTPDEDAEAKLTEQQRQELADLRLDREMLRKAQENLDVSAAHPIGVVARARPGWGYYVMLHDVGDVQREFMRAWLDDRGYVRCGPDDPERVPDHGTAEIWRCPPSVHKMWTQDKFDFARCEGRWDGQDGNKWGAKGWKELRQLQTRQVPIEE
jgi:hypothetical protein